MVENCASESQTKEDIPNDVKVEYLDSPVKSDHDLKEYRVIKFQNGLIAMLVSDLHINDTKSKVSDYSHNEKEEEDTKNAQEAENEIPNTEETELENNDDNHCLNNTSDEDEDDEPMNDGVDKRMAACGLCVGVGSFSNPPNVQGLAHFLEHMVFMGSAKYPKKDDFDVFIDSYGGASNACTESEATTFYFELPKEQLQGALDRLAQFLINPLLKIESIDRESEIIESEFQLALPHDDNKKDQLISLWVKEGHPAAMLSCGNKKSLKSNTTNEELHDVLRKFRERHYSAHRMTLAVQASLPLDTIEDYVKKCFAAIPTNNLPPFNFDQFWGIDSFDMSKFHKIYRFKPSEDVCKLELVWPTPPSITQYRSKPTHYIGRIVGYKGKGSLINSLRRKCWVTDLFAWCGDSSFDGSSFYSLFRITLNLTDEGFNHIEEICDTVFSYLNLLKSLDPCKRIFDEIKQIDDTKFRFSVEASPIENVVDFCQNMQLYPPKDYLTGSELLFEYSPEEIVNSINLLDPGKVNILIHDPKSNLNRFDQTETWLKARYCVEDIPEEWVKKWNTIEPGPEFHLPEPNPFLTTNFDLVPLNEDIPEHPIIVYQNDLISIWHRLDPKFRKPECCISLSLKNSLMNISPSNFAMGDLLNTIVEYMLAEEIYPATCTKLENALSTSPRVINMEFYGWSQKLPLLIYTVVNYYVKLPSILTEEIFNVGKEKQLKTYYSSFFNTDDLQRNVAMSILCLNHWSMINKHSALSDITFDEFRHFVTHFLDNLEISFLVQGNMTKEDAIIHGQACLRILNCKPLSPETKPWFRVCQVPLGERCCRLRQFNSSNGNSSVMNYYHIEDTNIKSKALIEILMTIMHQPLYNELRTIQRLSYSVYCDLSEYYGIYGFTITVLNQASKQSTAFIDQKIEEFIVTLKDKLKKMPLDEFEDAKKTLIRLKLTEDNNLEEEFYKNSREIESGRLAFDSYEKDVKTIKDIDFEDFKKWFDDHTLGGAKFRKLSIQVVGFVSEDENVIQSDNTDEEKKEETSSKKKYKLQYLTNLDSDEFSKEVDYYITNPYDFKRTLHVYPVSYLSY